MLATLICTPTETTTFGHKLQVHLHFSWPWDHALCDNMLRSCCCSNHKWLLPLFCIHCYFLFIFPSAQNQVQRDGILLSPYLKFSYRLTVSFSGLFFHIVSSVLCISLAAYGFCSHIITYLSLFWAGIVHSSTEEMGLPCMCASI